MVLSAEAQDTSASKGTRLSLIPQPLNVIEAPGSFSLKPGTSIVIDGGDKELKRTASILSAHLKSLTGFSIPVKTGAKGNVITLSLKDAPDSLEKEGYLLVSTPEGLTLRANTNQAIFYGMQTIYQLLPPNGELQASNQITIPAVTISDKPRYGWRGMMLDVCRHFYPVDFVKQFIDYLAMHKMNNFHWHLTDDQGWRIEIKKYPNLTKTGAWREGTLIGAYSNDQKFDSVRHGGFYTQDQIREVVAYAKERYINVVPEIEMPGHAVAALSSYPELSCTGGPFKVGKTWGVYDDVFCAGNEKTFEFLENVLTEVAELFPSSIIHIGGDESPKTRWKVCPKCQARIKAEGLKDEHELQSYFIKRIEKFLLTKNKDIIGWDEILEGGLAPNAAVMSWRGTEGGIAAAKQHHEVVMSPNSHLYFDHYQGKASGEPLAIGGYTTLERVYSYDPTPAELTKEEAKFIKGVQANLWTEYIPETEKVEYMVMPRMAALAEVAWTQPSEKNWEDFKRRMEDQYGRYDKMGINYSKSAYNVRQKIVIESARSRATVTLSTDSDQPQIFYTLDGSEPNTGSKTYLKPFDLFRTATVKAAAFKNGKQIGKTSVQSVVFDK
ncbi:family 20 glycosylhydrolase [Flavihumibacter sp. R14]|nr:family 20 glycosylhydrolase [Flavihumibacter soli]